MEAIFRDAMVDYGLHGWDGCGGDHHCPLGSLGCNRNTFDAQALNGNSKYRYHRRISHPVPQEVPQNHGPADTCLI